MDDGEDGLNPASTANPASGRRPAAPTHPGMASALGGRHGSAVSCGSELPAPPARADAAMWTGPPGGRRSPVVGYGRPAPVPSAAARPSPRQPSGRVDLGGVNATACSPSMSSPVPAGGPAAGHRHRPEPGRRADPPCPRRTDAHAPRRCPVPPTRGPDRVASPLGQTRSGSRSPGAASALLRPRLDHAPRLGAGWRGVSRSSRGRRSPSPPRRAATVAGHASEGRPALAGRCEDGVNLSCTWSGRRHPFAWVTLGWLA
jgi:hypothetical protein